jgi:hypothetical protein
MEESLFKELFDFPDETGEAHEQMSQEDLKQVCKCIVNVFATMPPHKKLGKRIRHS